MILAVIVVLSWGLTGLHLGQDLASGVARQDRSSEIADLLKHLTPAAYLLNGVPHSDTIDRVRAQLVLIANQSPDSRKSVIDALIRVSNDPKTEFDVDEVDRWRVAVALLGELNATEAIDDLVRNINWTGHDTGPIAHPPVRTALVRIGKPAVPRLLSALSDPNGSVRREASEALGEIGEPSVGGLVGVLARAGPLARASAADALARIGGARAREAIEIALRLETDVEAKKRLEYAVGYMDHVKCMKDSSKCK